MKKKIQIVLLSATLAGAVFVSCTDEDATPAETSLCIPVTLQDGLITAYTFGSGSLTDAAGSADLTLFGNVQPGEDREGNAQCAFVFDGQSTSYLSTQNVTGLNGLDEMTVSLWYKPNVVDGGLYQSLITTNLQYPYEAGFWSIGTYDCLKAVFSTGNNGAWDNSLLANSFDCESEVEERAGTWHYLTATYSLTNGEIKIFHDGVLQDTDGLDSVAPGIITSLYIGNSFWGTIDDVAIYNKVLTQAEITALYELNACCQ